MKAELSDSHNLIDDLQKKLDVLNTELLSKTVEIKNLEEKFKCDTDHILKIKSEEMEAKGCVYLNKISCLELQIEEQKSIFDEQIKNLAHKDTLINQLNCQVDELKLKIENSQHLVSDKETEIEKFKNDIKFFEEKIGSQMSEIDDLGQKISHLNSFNKQNENKINSLECENKNLKEKIDFFKNLNEDLIEQNKTKNEDIENWMIKFFELEKKLDQADIELKSLMGQKRSKSNESIQLAVLEQGKRRKVRLEQDSIKEIQTSMELDLNIGESCGKVCEPPETQTIPVYQLPKNSSSKTDGFDCLENVPDQYFLKNYQQCIKESAESYRLKRQSRYLSISIADKPVITSTPNSPSNNSSSGSDIF